MTGTHAPLSERLWRKVEILHPRECWVFTGSKNIGGYGKIGVGGRSGGHMPAHRAAWEDFYGSIPDGMFVLHRCDNRPCVNPYHLFLGTARDNLLDAISKGRHAPPPPRAIKAECPYGHDYTKGDNYHYNRYANGRVDRSCLTCHREGRPR